MCCDKTDLPLQQPLKQIPGHHRALPWPVKSPDMSWIEHIWDIIGHLVCNRPQMNLQELGWALQEEWGRIPREITHCIFVSMPRYHACISALGHGLDTDRLCIQQFLMPSFFLYLGVSFNNIVSSVSGFGILSA